MSISEHKRVTRMHPVELVGVRDEGMQALILLAASLGWDVRKKHNQPVIITAPNGTQKRLPTDTSIRMSVFQSALSMIMVHSENEPTIELIDQIIATTKPSKDHERRLRLAVGETVAEHRQRLANVVPATNKRTPDEHLTQQPDVPIEPPEVHEDTAEIREALLVPPSGPFDGQEHGMLVLREPTKALFSGTQHGAYTYTSKVSYRRVWTDGYVDYECMVCGVAGRSPRGIGAHRQLHTRAGVVEAVGPRPYTAPGTVINHDPNYTPPEKQMEFVDELPPEDGIEAPPEDEVILVDEEHEVTPEMADNAMALLDAITKLLQPRLVGGYEARIAELIAERDEARKKLAEVEGEIDALAELLTSRKKER